MMDFLTEHAPIIGLLFFFSVFSAVVAWLLLPGMKNRMEAHGRLPLQEDSHG